MVVVLTFVFILCLAPYLSGADFGLFKIPQFTDVARKRLKIIAPIFLLLSIMLFVPIIPLPVKSDNANRINTDGKQTNPDTSPDRVIILVADFKSLTERNFGVTEKIIQKLRIASSEYSDISIDVLGQPITEQQGSKVARDIGTERKASIVLWGYYNATSEAVDISVYFEVLRAPKYLSLRQNLETKTSPISELEGFKIQTRLSGEMTYLTLLTVGLARYESGDYEGAIKRFTTALAQSDVPDKMINPADIYFYRAGAYYYRDGANGIDQAIADYDKAIEIKPDFAEAYYNRALAYQYKGERDRAIADLKHVLRITNDPNLRQRAEKNLRELGVK